MSAQTDKLSEFGPWLAAWLLPEITRRGYIWTEESTRKERGLKVEFTHDFGSFSTNHEILIRVDWPTTLWLVRGSRMRAIQIFHVRVWIARPSTFSKCTFSSPCKTRETTTAESQFKRIIARSASFNSWHVPPIANRWRSCGAKSCQMTAGHLIQRYLRALRALQL
jgi:hypothetical protein